MKRFLVLLCAALLLTACHDASQDPVIRGYRIEHLSGMGIGEDGVTVDLTLVLDVENPARAPYSIESLEATVYKGDDKYPFATASLKDTAAIAAKTTAEVSLPLHVVLLRPLALLSDKGLDLSQYCADIDMKAHKGTLGRRIQRKRVPLKNLEHLLGSYTIPTSNENQ